jgi:hypothetical protein
MKIYSKNSYPQQKFINSAEILFQAKGAQYYE